MSTGHIRRLAPALTLSGSIGGDTIALGHLMEGGVEHTHEIQIWMGDGWETVDTGRETAAQQELARLMSKGKQARIARRTSSGLESSQAHEFR